MASKDSVQAYTQWRHVLVETLIVKKDMMLRVVLYQCPTQCQTRLVSAPR